jgi:late competence protein required for DNA uptake (superfamily II DNA/RNA helicase)
VVMDGDVAVSHLRINEDGLRMRCSNCNQEISEDDAYVHREETLCEDCYLEAIQRVRVCDPWAVHIATSTREALGLKGTDGLSDLQKSIYEFIKSKGKITLEEVMGNFKLSSREMETQFAVLRHCELIRAYKENSRIYLTTFDSR